MTVAFPNKQNNNELYLLTAVLYESQDSGCIIYPLCSVLRNSNNGTNK